MKLSEENTKTLMLSLHQKIENYAENISENLFLGKSEDILAYPPNCSLTEEENESLKKLKDNSILKSALRKVFADNSASLIFDLFNIVDGTSDPDEELGSWTEIAFVDKTEEIAENSEMLHDNFFSTYWDWKKIRPKKDWKLDNIED